MCVTVSSDIFRSWLSAQYQCNFTSHHLAVDLLTCNHHTYSTHPLTVNLLEKEKCEMSD